MAALVKPEGSGTVNEAAKKDLYSSVPVRGTSRLPSSEHSVRKSIHERDLMVVEDG